MIIKFCEVAVGARFEFRGRRYEKMNSEVGRDEERGGNLFHARTEVVSVQNEERRVKNEGTKGTKRTEGGGRMSEVGRRRPEGWWLPPMRRVNAPMPVEAGSSEFEEGSFDQRRLTSGGY